MNNVVKNKNRPWCANTRGGYKGDRFSQAISPFNIINTWRKMQDESTRTKANGFG